MYFGLQMNKKKKIMVYLCGVEICQNEPTYLEELIMLIYQSKSLNISLEGI